MKHALIACLCALVTPVLAAEALRPEQFAEAVPITIAADYPVQQLALHDALYQRVVSPSLNDMAVFDATGHLLPHVLCTVPQQQRISEVKQPLTVFPVQLARAGGQGATAQVRTEGGNTIDISVPGSAPQATVAVTAYDLDLSALQAPTVALQVQWRSPRGLSEVHLKVEQADAHQQWHTVVADAVLKRLSADGKMLEQAEISMPPARYKTLRLTPRDADGTVIEDVQARTREITALPADLQWFTAVQNGPADDPAPFTGATQSYDTLRHAPVTLARITLAEPNTRFDLRLQSRASAQAAWQTVWAGEIFNLLTADGQRRSADIALPANTHRYWRVLAPAAVAPFTPILGLAYTPQNLRFIAAGQGPYRLAYGNAAAATLKTAASCESLLSSLNTSTQTLDVAQLIGSAETGVVQVLAGPAALQPLPPDTSASWRRWLLWAVLALAVLLLLGMARKLFSDLKNPA